MDIIICEDNHKFRENVETIIRNYAMIENLNINIALSTDSPLEVIQYISEKGSVDCYFLDIDLGENLPNGLELAKKIRENDKFSDVIFLTSHDEYTIFTLKYNLKALAYILKSDINTIKKEITTSVQLAYNTYIEKIKEKIVDNRIQIKVGEDIIFLHTDDILFFETASQKKLNVVLKNGSYEFYGKLKDIELLSELFVKANKSYVVNISNIVKLDNIDNLIYFENGLTCPVSRTHKDKFKK